MDCDARVPDGGSPAPLRATEIQLKETIDNKDNSPQILRVFTVFPFLSSVGASQLHPGFLPILLSFLSGFFFENWRSIYVSTQAPSVRCRTNVSGNC